ncbi:helix-turn-helix domain-containing protein [Streptomyces tubercidicus]|uniref:helix-turn-helix domain-containing protein n=1 Tax=Streptomyces tubercidicus TaxID=47759 RepID=UPI00346567EC
MTTVARHSGKSSQIERGEIAEVAALGNVLKELFNTLGISQSQYARRIGLDKSAVSRYLSGARLPTQEFTKRLVSEVEEDRGVPLQLEAKEAVHQQWLAALRVCDPAEYALESLRAELTRSRRDTERARRNVEALHQLLEQKEAEARDAADDLSRLRLDWSAERATVSREQIELRRERESLSSSREALLREIERLREDVREAERMRAEAVQHSSDLRERVLCLEKELSESRPAGAAGEIPLEALKGQLLQMWEEENFPEATRDLTEAAWARPLDEVVEIMKWLLENGGGEKLNAFVADVCRLRPVEDVIRFVPELDAPHRGRDVDAWVVAAASRMTERNADRFCRELKEVSGPLPWLGDRLLAAAVRQHTEPSEAVALLVKATTGMTPPLLLRLTVRAVLGGMIWDRTFPFVIVVGLFKQGQLFLASDITHELCERYGVTGPRSGYVPSRFFRGVKQLDTPTRDALLAFVAEMSSSRRVREFAEILLRGGGDDLRLLDQLLDELESRKALDLLFADEPSGESVTSKALRRYVRRRHR